ncbi:FHA domain-containing protein [Curvibacter sp. CHRR-16]|uniref:FHA domain-containing protein n=1 Tax=Curvibacter sp. CHRR-16 TaxID=2835872 RepID=UPI001BDB5C7A|nr:FHA domain-containing protein [Curvibacter sp. CHRR-16]MBT0569632.1 FHA domain-containing protein [Curvibacter sp. CHRR-16]
MALLWNVFRHYRAMLRPVHMLGRDPQACHTWVNAPDVSKLHVQIHWHDGRWELCDRSRNGTWINGRRIAPDQWMPLTLHDQIHISSDPIGHWSVTDLAPPCTSLLPDDLAQAPIALHLHGNPLPDTQVSQATVYVQNGQWVLEQSTGTEALQDGRRIRVADQAWEFVLCTLLSTTLDLEQLPCISPTIPDLHFHISQNEEHVTLNLQLGSQRIGLGERIHHYALVTLVRQRLQDMQRGIDHHSQGWLPLETLAGMLGIDTAYVNIQIFRARQQIAEALAETFAVHLSGLPPLVERRRGEVRFGTYACTIQKGSQEEGRLLPAVL